VGKQPLYPAHVFFTQQTSLVQALPPQLGFVDLANHPNSAGHLNVPKQTSSSQHSLG